jgi:hypothetical protein
MRDFKGLKRQRGRNRGGGGSSGGGKPQQHNANRAFDSNGPDGVKIRGAAQHVYEKYSQLARDTSSGGDRVLAENYLQHAEHYFRVLRAMQPQRPLAEIIGRDNFVSGYDIDFEDESGANAEQAEAAESETAEGGENGERFEQRGERQDRFEGRQRDDRPRDDYRRDRDDRPRDRDDRPRDDRPRDDRPRDDRPRDDRPRDDRPRDDRPRDDRPREFRDRNFRDRDRFNRDDRPQRQPDRDPLSVVEPEATPLVAAREAPVREARVREAPAREAPVRESPSARVLRADDGEVSHAPAFLQARAPEPTADDDAPKAAKPRRRRAPRSFEGDAAPAEADEG